jgi:hypothetical protein
MNRNTLYRLWLLAFGLKAIGASWDASYHFKYLRETTQLPHIVNSIGMALACLLFFSMWRKETTENRRPLKIVLIGILIFFLGIPFDEWYHRTFGIDLTTWSPAHFTLYTGTMIMILGMIFQTSQDYARGLITDRMRQVAHFAFFAFLFEDFWFPLLQQEQGVIAYYLFQVGTPIATEEILQFLSDPKSQIYGGIPDWLYGTYACFASVLIFRLIRSFGIGRFACTRAASLYVLFRLIMDIIYANTAYQTSTLPYFLLAAGLLFDLVCNWMEGGARQTLKVVLLNSSILITVHAVSFMKTDYPIHPPMPTLSIWLSIGSTLLGYWLAVNIYRYVFTNTPEKKMISQPVHPLSSS